MPFEELAKSEISKKIEEEKNNRGYAAMLWAYFKLNPLFGTTVVILAMITSALAVSTPLVMRQLITTLQIQGTTTFIIWQFGWPEWIIVQACLFAVLGCAVFGLNYAVGTLGRKVEVFLRNESLKALILQDISYYSDKKIGEILTKIGTDTWLVGEQTQNIPSLILLAFFNFIGSSVVLINIDWKLGLISMSFVAGGLAAIFIFFSRIKNWFSKLRTTITFVNGDVTDRIATVRLIKASGTEKYEKQRFRELHVDFYSIVKAFFNRLSWVLTSGFVAVMSLQLLIIGVGFAFYHSEPDKLVLITTSFMTGLGSMTSPIYQVLRLIFGLFISNECTRRVYQIIDSKPLIDAHYFNDQAIKVTDLNKDIILKDVSFNYPEDPSKNVLPKFNFTFKKGKSYAFVGETGSGKSTISKLLLRFYDPTEGAVLINENINLQDVQLKSYLDLVGYVEQEPQIIFGTVKDNIRYTTPWKTDEQVFEAAKRVNLHDLIMSWPLGYDTILGERGFMLSGGQKQRLVIARMFLKDPQLLILDEATSALDNIVEKEVQAELEMLMVGRTSVTIAHKLSTIKNCDQIIVLAPGQGMVQIGTFDELRKKPGHFKNLYEAGLMSEQKAARQ